MAILLNIQTEQKITLLAQHIFGRHPGAANTLLNNRDSSRMHATVFWDGQHWLLQDTSKNGTFINKKLMKYGTKVRLNKGDEINFVDIKQETWRLIDSKAPKSMLVPLTPGLPLIALEDIVVLPAEDLPEISLYLSPLGHWMCESQSGISVLKSGDKVGTSECTWRFIEARSCEETQSFENCHLVPPSHIEIYFNVSQNEEHVSLKIKTDHQEIDLEQRNHHYLLLLLARKRLADKDNGLSGSEQGWLDKELLGKMMKLSENHINIQIYRFRKQLISALPQSLILPQAIERRTGEIRIAYDSIVINCGSPIERSVNILNNK